MIEYFLETVVKMKGLINHMKKTKSRPQDHMSIYKYQLFLLLVVVVQLIYTQRRYFQFRGNINIDAKLKCNGGILSQISLLSRESTNNKKRTIIFLKNVLLSNTKNNAWKMDFSYENVTVRILVTLLDRFWLYPECTKSFDRLAALVPASRSLYWQKKHTPFSHVTLRNVRWKILNLSFMFYFSLIILLLVSQNELALLKKLRVQFIFMLWDIVLLSVQHIKQVNKMKYVRENFLLLSTNYPICSLFEKYFKLIDNVQIILFT